MSPPRGPDLGYDPIQMEPGTEETAHMYLTVLFVREGDFYVAQALEHDIAAQGSSIQKAKEAFEHAFVGRILLDRRMKREPLSTLGRAPQRFWAIFTDLVKQHTALTTEPVDVSDSIPGMPPAFMVQAIADTPCNHSAQS